MALRFLHHRHLAQLFSSLLDHLPMLRLHSRTRFHCSHSIIHRGQHLRHRANAKRSRSMALRRQDYTHSLWPCRHRCCDLRAHCPHCADGSRASARHFLPRMPGIEGQINMMHIYLAGIIFCIFEVHYAHNIIKIMDFFAVKYKRCIFATTKLKRK